MATAREIVRSALLEVKVVSGYDEVDPQDANDVLAKLNQLMHSLSSHNLTYTHTTMTLNTEFPFDDKLHHHAVMWLSEAIAGMFGKAFTREQSIAAQNGVQAITAEYYTTPEASFDTGLVEIGRDREYVTSS